MRSPLSLAWSGEANEKRIESAEERSAAFLGTRNRHQLKWTARFAARWMIASATCSFVHPRLDEWQPVGRLGSFPSRLARRTCSRRGPRWFALSFGAGGVVEVRGHEEAAGRVPAPTCLPQRSRERISSSIAGPLVAAGTATSFSKLVSGEPGQVQPARRLTAPI